MSARIGKLMTDRASEKEIEEVAQEEGMIMMRQDGIVKALDGVTTIEEVLRVTAKS